MPNQKRTLDEPAIRELLSGLVRSADKRYYRRDPDTGFYMQVSARAELLKLTSQVTASRLLREAVSSGLIELRELPPEPPKPKLASVEPEDEGETELAPHHQDQVDRIQRRFQLVKSMSRHGTYWGIYDADYHTQELISDDKQEALAELRRRIRQEQEAVVPYYLQFKSGLAA